MSRLTTIFGANTKPLDKGISRAENNVGRFSKNVQRRMRSAFSVMAIGYFFRSLTQKLDRVGKLASRGFSTDFVQDLSHTADLAGSSIESLLPKISAMFREINKGGTISKEFEDNLKAIGLTVDQVRGQSPEQLFKTVVDALQSTEDKGRAAAAAMVLLRDRTGELLPVLDSLANDGLRESARASEDSIRSAEKLKDMWTVFSNTFMAIVAPAITFVLHTLMLAVNGVRRVSAYVIGANNAIAESTRGMVRIAMAASKFDLSAMRDEFRKTKRAVQTEIDAIGIAIDNADKDLENFVNDMEKRKAPSALAGLIPGLDDEDGQGGGPKPGKISKSVIATSIQKIGGGGASAVMKQDMSLQVQKDQLSELRGLRRDIQNLPSAELR